MNLSISGKSIALRQQYSPQLGTRKIYNATFFRDEDYHHEIANHYRDFKRRPRIRRRRRNVFVHYRKTPLAIPIGMDPYEYRDELPMAIKHFPSFALVYTPPRGRQCQCESQPPDETYNDSVRRIRAARSCDELRSLVQRYCGYVAKKEKHYRQHKQTSRQGKYETNETRSNESKSDSKQQAAIQPYKQPQQIQQRPKQRRSLGNLQSVSTTSVCGKQEPPHSSDCTDCDKTTKASTELYLQLASEHYVREYLENVKYLESIPERNALIRMRYDINSKGNENIQTETLTASCENNLNHSRVAFAKSNASNSSTATDETTPRRTCELNFGIANLLRLIGRKRSFHIGSNDSTENETVCEKIKNWAIRVNITPTAGELSTTASDAADVNERKHSREQSNTDSMHDFLNANTGKAIQILETTNFYNNNNNNYINNSNSSVNGLVSNTEWSTEHLHSIIDNLTQLDLNALNSSATADLHQSLIPQITLTNYCDFTKKQFYEGQNPLDIDNIDNQALKSATSACNSTLLLKPTKFIYKANLDIPSEINYQSEARPP